MSDHNKCGHGKTMDQPCLPCEKLYASLEDASRLRVENARLTERIASLESVLVEIAGLQHHSVVSGHKSWQQIAREVLAPKAPTSQLNNTEIRCDKADAKEPCPACTRGEYPHRNCILR